MFKAVLFDLDGTLVRTMEAYFVAWRDACQTLGFNIKESDYYPLEGMEAHALAEVLCDKYGRDVSLAGKIVELKKGNIINAFTGRKADIYPGVEVFLEKLFQNKIPMALVTASVREQVAAYVDPALLQKFSAIVTGEMYERGKPFPDPYLLGAQKLGVDPSMCVGVENAPLGIKSVKSAGAYCVAVASTVTREVLREADEVAPAFADIAKTKAFTDWL